MVSLHYLYTLTPHWFYWLHVISSSELTKFCKVVPSDMGEGLVNVIMFFTIDPSLIIVNVTLPGWMYLIIIGNRVAAFLTLSSTKKEFPQNTQCPQLYCLCCIFTFQFRFINLTSTLGHHSDLNGQCCRFRFAYSFLSNTLPT